MNKLSTILIFLLLFNICKGQSKFSCQGDNWHPVMEKRVLITENTQYSDSIIVILHDSLPPISWWQSDKRPNGVKYNKQKLVEVINVSTNPILVVKPDRQLMLGLQAKKNNGEWVDVEVFFQGRCARSFRESNNDTLKSKETWLTFVEITTGSIKTKYRVKLQLVTQNYSHHHFYYSNEIDGKIEPCMFIKKY